MAKIFIDCGGHKGESIARFKRLPIYSSDFILYSFEPLGLVNKSYKDNKDLIFSNKAVWIEDCEKDFYIGKDKKKQGSTLKVEKKTCGINKNDSIKVGCINFSKWIMDTFNKDDEIILKMDIEGAEYDVLNKMIEDGSIYYVKKLFIEWHIGKTSLHFSIHENLIKKLEEIKGLEILKEMKIYEEELR